MHADFSMPPTQPAEQSRHTVGASILDRCLRACVDCLAYFLSYIAVVADASLEETSDQFFRDLCYGRHGGFHCVVHNTRIQTSFLTFVTIFPSNAIASSNSFCC